MTLLIIIFIIIAVGVGVWYISRRRPAERDFGGQAKPKPLMVQQKQPMTPKPFEAPKPPMIRPTPPLPPTPPTPPFPPSTPPKTF